MEARGIPGSSNGGHSVEGAPERKIALAVAWGVESIDPIEAFPSIVESENVDTIVPRFDAAIVKLIDRSIAVLSGFTEMRAQKKATVRRKLLEGGVFLPPKEMKKFVDAIFSCPIEDTRLVAEFPNFDKPIFSVGVNENTQAVSGDEIVGYQNGTLWYVKIVL